MKRTWIALMGLSLLLGAACSRSETNSPQAATQQSAALPPIQGPALVLFYTDN